MTAVALKEVDSVEVRIVIDNANLSWFLDFVDTAERLTIVSSPLEFIARVRKP